MNSLAEAFPLRRISTLATAAEIDLELRREELRDRRWQRWRSMLYTTSSLSALTLGTGLLSQLPHSLGWL
jgi:hypothetical protein